jgi:nonribosomal peptide synthetase DhbF
MGASLDLRTRKREPLPESVEQMAADYVRLIRAVQPEGPYHLLGWSFGGTVAFAMARLLQRDGARTPLVALFDAVPTSEADTPAPGTPVPDDPEKEALTTLLRDSGYGDRIPEGAPLTVAYATEIPQRDGNVVGSLGEGGLSALVGVYGNNAQLARAYRPGLLDGDLLLFTARDELQQGAPTREQLWLPHARRVINHDIPCRHHEMTLPVPITRIGRIVSQALFDLARKVEQ